MEAVKNTLCLKAKSRVIKEEQYEKVLTSRWPARENDELIFWPPHSLPNHKSNNEISRNDFKRLAIVFPRYKRKLSYIPRPRPLKYIWTNHARVFCMHTLSMGWTRTSLNIQKKNQDKNHTNDNRICSFSHLIKCEWKHINQTKTWIKMCGF